MRLSHGIPAAGGAILAVMFTALGLAAMNRLVRQEPAVSVAETRSYAVFPSETLPMVRGRSLVQEFDTNGYNNLARIDLPVFKRESAKGALHMRIRYSRSGPVVREAVLPVRAMAEGTRTPFIFPVLAHAAGKAWYLELEGTAQSEDEALTVGGVSCDCLNGDLYGDAGPNVQDLQMTVFALPPAPSRADELLDRTARLKPDYISVSRMRVLMAGSLIWLGVAIGLCFGLMLRHMHWRGAVTTTALSSGLLLILWVELIRL